MTSSYAIRLVCLSLAVLLLANVAIGAVVAIFAGPIIRRVERWRAESGARMMFVLRMLPAVGSLFLVFAICIPSYLRLEPQAVEEDIGFACLVSAALGAVLWGFALVRTASAVVRSDRYLRNWRRRGERATIGCTKVWVVEGGHTLALAGIFRPQLIVSRQIVDALPVDQLAAALRHECAHANAWDNFKRLMMLLAPDAAWSRRVERAWARFTEWSADDRAAEGGQDRPVELAAALVSVARLGTPSVPPLATALMANPGDLEVRVERLLQGRSEVRPVPFIMLAGSALSAGTMIALALHPATISLAYRILERLVD